MAYDDIRLKKSDAETSEDVMYFCPCDEFRHSVRNNPFKQDLANGDGSKIKDRLILSTEIIIQGEFVHSNDMDSSQVTALRSHLGTSGEITPMMQVRRMWYYIYKVGGAFDLYSGNDTYSGTEIDISAGGAGSTFQSVYIDSFEPVLNGGQDHLRVPYTLKLTMGQDEEASE